MSFPAVDPHRGSNAVAADSGGVGGLGRLLRFGGSAVEGVWE